MSVKIERSFEWVGIVVYYEKVGDNSREHLSLPGWPFDLTRGEQRRRRTDETQSARSPLTRPLIGRCINDDELHFNFTQMSAWVSVFNALQPSLSLNISFAHTALFFNRLVSILSHQNHNGIALPALTSAFCDESSTVASCFPTARQTCLQHKSPTICLASWRARTRNYPERNTKHYTVKASYQGPERIPRQGSPREPCWRTGCDSHLHGADTSDCQGTSASSTFDEAYV